MATTHNLAIINSHPIQYFAALYRRLAIQPDIDLTVFYCSQRGLEEYMDPGFGMQIKWDVPLLDGYRSKFLPNLSSIESGSSTLRHINPTILPELRRGHFDAIWIHGHNALTYMLAFVAAKMLGRAIFMRCETHLQLQRSSLKRFLRSNLLSIFYRFFDVCMPIGSRNAEFYRAHGVSEERMFLVPYTVDNEFFQSRANLHRAEIADLKRSMRLPHSKPIILYASKLIERKHPLDLLHAFHRLRLEGISAALVYVGSGSEEAKLKHYVDQHQLQDVFFFGFKNQTELPRYYACANVFVLPSDNEPWGLVVNEVMAAGVPVVTSEEVGAASDLVIPGRTGYTYPARDVGQLTERLRRIVTDQSLQKELAQNALSHIGNWNIERSVAGVRQALEFAARQRARS